MYLSAMLYITAISCFLFEYFALHRHHTPSARDSISCSKTDEKKKEDWSSSELKGFKLFYPIFRKALPFFIRMLQIVASEKPGIYSFHCLISFSISHLYFKIYF